MFTNPTITTTHKYSFSVPSSHLFFFPLELINHFSIIYCCVINHPKTQKPETTDISSVMILWINQGSTVQFLCSMWDWFRLLQQLRLCVLGGGPGGAVSQGLEFERPPHWSICQLVLALLGMLLLSFMLSFFLQKSRPSSSLKHGSWVPREQMQNLAVVYKLVLLLTQPHFHLMLLFKAGHMTSSYTKVNRLHLIMEKVACTNGEDRNYFWPFLKALSHSILHTCISFLGLP